MRLALLLSLLVGACTGSAPSPMSDATLELREATGSPPHHYLRTLRLGPDGGALGLSLSYGEGADTTFAFPLAEAERTALWSDLDALGLWSRRWNEGGNPPVGGSSWSLDARDGRRRADIPGVVTRRHRDARTGIRERIETVVPSSVRPAADAWRMATQSRLSE